MYLYLLLLTAAFIETNLHCKELNGQEAKEILEAREKRGLKGSKMKLSKKEAREILNAQEKKCKEYREGDTDLALHAYHCDLRLRRLLNILCKDSKKKLEGSFTKYLDEPCKGISIINLPGEPQKSIRYKGLID